MMPENLRPAEKQRPAIRTASRLCECCGETCPYCCTVKRCNGKGLCVTYSNLSLALVDGPTLTIPGTYQLSLENFGCDIAGHVVTNNWYVLDAGYEYQITMYGSFEPAGPCEVGDDTSAWMYNWTLAITVKESGGFAVWDGSVTLSQTSILQTGLDCDSEIIEGETTGSPLITTFLGTLSGDATWVRGPCDPDTDYCDPVGNCTAEGWEDLCCAQCCNDSADWFCGGTDMPVPGSAFTATATGSCSGAWTLVSYGNAYIMNGVPVVWLLFPSSGSSEDKVLYITCDGDVYSFVGVDGGPAPYHEWSLVGAVDTIDACDPLEFDIVLDSGPCAGTTVHVTKV